MAKKETIHHTPDEMPAITVAERKEPTAPAEVAASAPIVVAMLSITSYMQQVSVADYIGHILHGLYRKEMKTKEQWDVVVQYESTKRV